MKHAVLAVVLTLSLGSPSLLGEPDEIESYLRARSVPLATPADLDPLLERIGDARVVLLGEASHGTSEYYTWRAAISQRLIAEKGFSFIAVEGDWPSCYEVNRYIRGLPGAAVSAEAALASFQRWPPWMWGNRETADLAEWLAAANRERPADRQVGFYGIDVYSLPESLGEVLAYARMHAPDLLEPLQASYDCLLAFADDPQSYARHTRTGRHCAEQALAALELLRGHAERLREENPRAFFAAKQNAHVVKRAEMHYRAMADPAANSWNKRAEHMTETLVRLLDEYGPDARGIVWGHNTHIGDARATDMARAGMVNIGQQARERFGAEQVVAVGFTTHRGRVLAGRRWGGDMETLTIPPAQPGSIEDIYHRLGEERLLSIFDDQVPAGLRVPLGNRAVGVVFNPETEERNYVPTRLAERYDAFVFLAETTPLRVLGANPSAAAAEVPQPNPPAARERAAERERMVETQIASPPDGRPPIACPRVLEAMRRVPRHAMVPRDLSRRAYQDSPLPIGHGQTISQPYIVAMMTELLEVSPGDRILEIGAGSGYQAAVLAHLTPEVYSIEIIEPLLDHTRTVLEEQDYGRIRLKHGDGYHGWAEHAPYDSIIVTCAAGHLPPPLWEQLKPGGRIVIPIGGAYEVQRLVVVTKEADGRRRSRTIMPVRFVPLTRSGTDGE